MTLYMAIPLDTPIRTVSYTHLASYEDLDIHKCTIEEREEYEPHIDKGILVFAGVDYAEILKRAEEEADVILWDGGNNDVPFYKSDCQIVLVDPHRPGHEMLYLSLIHIWKHVWGEYQRCF